MLINSSSTGASLPIKRIFYFTIGCIFFVSAVSKGLSYADFVAEVNELTQKILPLPQIVIAVCTKAFLLIEILLGIAFLSGKINRPFLIMALFVAFFFFIINTYRVLQNPVQECNCFGEFIQMDVIYSMLLDIVMLLAISRLLTTSLRQVKSDGAQ